MQKIQQNEGTAARRRVYLWPKDVTDFHTPEAGEDGLQPQLSLNGGAFSNTTNVLVYVSNGLYYVELDATEVTTRGVVIVRHKSANTTECQEAVEIGLSEATWMLSMADHWQRMAYQSATGV